MTDPSLTQLTQAGLSTISHADQTLIPSLSRVNQANITPLEDEEDGVIKCFCNYQEDDGATVLCEKCNTWQHIECYYASPSDVPDVHECADCEPRVFDGRRATERQRRKQEQTDINPQQKPKKPATKSHKRKTRVADGHLHLNGFAHDKDDSAVSRSRIAGSVKDHAQSFKTPKTSHKASGSIQSSLILTHSLGWGPNRSASTSQTIRSPSKSSHTNSPDAFRCEPYSPEFLHLYDNDPGEVPLKANLFNDITITDQLQLWSHDVEALGEVTNGKQPQEIFQRCDLAIDSMMFPELRKEHKQDESMVMGGVFPKWTMIKVDVDIPQNSIVGELKGQIGHMNNYVQDSTNRWDYLRHPAPFVFFHDQLPIYIDTRREGTICRYLRRSCRPNLSLRTFLEGSDYHFCFVANQDLPAGTELTTGWRLDQHIRSFLSGNDTIIKQEGLEDSGRNYISDWVGKVFAEFGDCACDHPEGCIFQKYDPRSPMLVNEFRRGIKRHTSHHYQKPWSSGKMSNSRSGSEGAKRFDGEDDSRSLSGSTSRSPHSGDTTPTKLGLKNNGGILETSDREKRKLADVERAFEQMEQKRNQSNKKRKRTSGGSNAHVPSAPETSSHCAPSITTSRVFTERTSTSRSDDFNPLGTSPLVNGSYQGNSTSKIASTKRTYVDASTQTNPDPVNDIASFIYRPLQNPPRYESLRKRLMRRAREQRYSLSQMRDKWFLDHPNHSEAAKYRTNTEKLASKDIVNHSTSFPGSANSDDTFESRSPAYELPSLPAILRHTKRSPSQAILPSSSVKEPDSDKRGILPLPPESKPYPNPRPTPLSVLLPSPPLLNAATKANITMSTTPPPTLVASNHDLSTIRAPYSYPPLPVPASLPLGHSIAQSSPVKKISLGDYMSRRSSNKLETPVGSSLAVPSEQPSEALQTSAEDIVEQSKATLEEDGVVGDPPNTAPHTDMAQHASKEKWMDIDIPPQMA